MMTEKITSVSSMPKTVVKKTVSRSEAEQAAGRARWTMRWKPALNAFAVTFADRMPAAENL